MRANAMNKKSKNINISESDLHLYITNPSLLNKKVIDAIETDMETNPDLIEKFNDINEFYKSFHALNNSYNSSSYQLTLVNKPETISYKLAAQQSSTRSGDLKYISTFATAEKVILARLFYRTLTDEYEIHILCEEDMDTQGNYMVIIPGFTKPFIADKNGIIKIKSPFVYEHLPVTVRIPVAVFKLKSIPTDTDKSLHLSSRNKNHNVDLEIMSEGNTLKCNIKFIEGITIGKIKAVIFEPGNENNYSLLEINRNSFFVRTISKEITIILIEI